MHEGGSMHNYQKQRKARWGRLPKTEVTKMGVDYPKRKQRAALEVRYIFPKVIGGQPEETNNEK